jgi:hypothetical protein
MNISTVIKYPFYAIFILVLIISANFLAQLFPCRFQRALQDNMYLKHLFGLLTLNFFVLLSLPEFSTSLYECIKSSSILYLFFMIITKTDVAVFYTILLLLGISYLIQLNINILVKKTEKNTTVIDDPTENPVISNSKLSEQTLTQENKTINDIDFYKNVTYYLNLIIIVFTILGFTSYLGEKKYDYKTKFNYLKFLFGRARCKDVSPNLSYLEAIKYAFA